MKLRHQPRYKRRLPVRFWEPDKQIVHEAFTTDVSMTGMFIATRVLLPTGSRFRLELLEPGHNYVFQVEVARSTRLAPELRRLGNSGMGVRLLRIHELLRGLIPAGADAPGPAAPATASSPAGAPERPPAPGRYVLTGEAPAAATAADAEPEGAAAAPLYLVRFSSPEVFLQVFLSHRQEGGFFVPTQKPAPTNSRIRVGLELVGSDLPPLELEGGVTSHLRDETNPDGEASGMLVSFAEPEAALEELRAVIRKLRGGGSGR